MNQPNPSKRARRRRKSHPPTPRHVATLPNARPVDLEMRPQLLAVDEGGGEEGVNPEWLTAAFSSASLGDGTDAYRAVGRKVVESHRRKKAESVASGIVSNVIGKGYGRRAVNVASAVVEKKGEGRAMEEFLYGMLGHGCEIDVGVVKDVLGHCGYDIEKAIDILLDMSSSTVKDCVGVDFLLHNEKFINFPQKGFGTDHCLIEDKVMPSSMLDGGSGDFKLHNKKLININQERSDDSSMEGKLSDKTTESSSGMSENDFDYWYSACCDYGTKTGPICTWEEQPSLSCTDKHKLQKEVLQSLFGVPGSSQRDPKLMNWKKVVKKLRSFGQGQECSISSSDDTNLNQINEDIYPTLRGPAREHWETMKSYYQRAADAYTKGERAYASYLPEKGRFFYKLAREADEKASRQIFEARNKGIRNEITIDLHGQHVKEAMRLLKLHLLISTYVPSIQLLRVITGRGSHRGGKKGNLKQSVEKLVMREGIQWREENPGTILIAIDRSKVYSFVETDNDDDDFD